MGAYQGEWSLLGVPGDPWPGEPGRVDAAARYYSGLADDIRSQVATLKRLAEDLGSLEGEFAPALRESSEELAEVLERAEGRFEAVGSELGRWEPELASAQQQSRAMLREAESHHAAVVANHPSSTPVDPDDDAAVSADQARGRRLEQASADLDAVVRRFRSLHATVDGVARQIAGRIKDASHDSLKNHRFDGLRQWIHEHAEILKMIADVLTFIATAIVLAIVIVGTGGLALAVLATAAALLIHTALAAQGDGSWVDVGLDAFALVTLGAGKLLTTGAKGLLAAREGVAAYEETTAAARLSFQNATGLSKAVVYLTESNPVVRTVTALRSSLTAFSTTWRAEYEGGLAARLVFGDKEAAGLAKAIFSATERLGPGQLLDTASGLMHTASRVFHASVAVDLTFKLLNDAHPFLFNYPGNPSWVTWKEEHTVHAISAP